MSDYQQKPVQLKESKEQATAGPSEDDRFDKGALRRPYEARLAVVSEAGAGKLRIMIYAGRDQGVRIEMPCYLKGLDKAFSLEVVENLRSYAVVSDIKKEQLKNGALVMINALPPAAKPRKSRPVQRRANGAGSTADVQATARAGVANASARLPHFDTIQRAFGKHDISDVQAQVGGEAMAASGALGAEAYATGNKVAFASSPDLHTAAHEAAHTIQQRNGAVGFQGLGAAGDEHERHADAVADAVVAGRSAEALLDRVTTGQTSSTAGAVQLERAHADTRVGASDLLSKDSSDPVRLPTAKETKSTGEEWEQQGACVRENPGVEGCYLSNTGREALLRNLVSRMNTTQNNYKLAATELKTDVRLKKESDFSFIPTIYKEFVTSTLIGAIAKGIIKLRGGEKNDIEIFTDEAIKTVTKSLGGYGVKQGEGALKKDLGHGATDAKTGKLAYLGQVQSDVDVYFEALRLSCQRDATDAQLQVLYEGMAPDLNSVDVLREALAAKLDRFVKSGVLQIGRGMAPKRTDGGDTTHVHDDRRVVWIWVGAEKVLFYEHHESKFGAPDDGGYGSTNSRNDGARRFGKPVPREFWTQALAASETKWGTTPMLTLGPDKMRELTGRAR